MATALQSLAGLGGAAVGSWTAAKAAYSVFGDESQRADVINTEAARNAALSSLQAITSLSSGEGVTLATGELAISWTLPRQPIVVWQAADGVVRPRFAETIANYALGNSASLVL
jgi:hypothetical protein